MITRSIKLDIRIDIKDNEIVNFNLFSAYAPISEELRHGIKTAIIGHVLEKLIEPELCK